MDDYSLTTLFHEIFGLHPQLTASEISEIPLSIFNLTPLPILNNFQNITFDDHSLYSVAGSLFKIGFHFPFIPDVLNYFLEHIPEIEQIEDKKKEYIVSYILYTFVAWFLYFSKTNDSQYNLLISQCLLMSYKYTNKPELVIRTYLHAFKTFFRDHNFNTSPDLKQIFFLFSNLAHNSSLFPNIFTNILQDLINLLINQKVYPCCATNPNVSWDFLRLISFLSYKNSPIICSIYAHDLICSLKPYLISLDFEALSCFKYILPQAKINEDQENEKRRLMIIQIFQSIACSILNTIEQNHIEYAWPNDSTLSNFPLPNFQLIEKEEMSCFFIYPSFKNGISKKSPNFPEIPSNWKIEMFLYNPLKNAILLVLEVLMGCPEFIPYFIEALFDQIQKRITSPSIAAFYTHAIFICKSLKNKSETPVELAQFLFKTTIFDQHICCNFPFLSQQSYISNDQKNGIKLMNYLRDLSLQLTFTENENIISNIFSSFARIPLLYAELVWRLFNYNESLFNILSQTRVNHFPQKSLISNLLYFRNLAYCYAKMENKTEDIEKIILSIEAVRDSLLCLIFTMANSDVYRIYLFRDKFSCLNIVLHLFESSISFQIKNLIFDFYMKSDPSEWLSICSSLSHYIMHSFFKIYPKDVHLIFNCLDCFAIAEIYLNSIPLMSTLNQQILRLKNDENHKEEAKIAFLGLIRCFQFAHQSFHFSHDETLEFLSRIQETFGPNITDSPEIYEHLIDLCIGNNIRSFSLNDPRTHYLISSYYSKSNKKFRINNNLTNINNKDIYENNETNISDKTNIKDETNINDKKKC